MKAKVDRRHDEEDRLADKVDDGCLALAETGEADRADGHQLGKQVGGPVESVRSGTTKGRTSWMMQTSGRGSRVQLVQVIVQRLGLVSGEHLEEDRMGNRGLELTESDRGDEYDCFKVVRMIRGLKAPRNLQR